MALPLPRWKKGMSPLGRPRLSVLPLCAQGCQDSWGCSCWGLGNCCLSLSHAQMSPAMSGPSTCSPWTKTSSAWSCLSSSATTSWSVGHSCRDAALHDGSLPRAHLLGPGQKSFVRGVDAWCPAQSSQPLAAGPCCPGVDFAWRAARMGCGASTSPHTAPLPGPLQSSLGGSGHLVRSRASGVGPSPRLPQPQSSS